MKSRRHRFAVRLVSLALVSASAVTACGSSSDAADSDCEKQCESHKKCGLLSDTNCSSACATSQNSAKSAGCSAELDAWMKCLAPDYCTAKCDAENAAYSACITKNP